MRLGRRHVALVVAVGACAAAVATWAWLDRPASSLRCADGRRPSRAVVSALIGCCHGGMGATMVVEGDHLDVDAPMLTKETRRELTPAEREQLFQRLERPSTRQLAALGRAEGIFQLSKTCGGRIEDEELDATVGAQHATFGSWLASPGELRLLGEALAGAVRDLDPRPKRIVATSMEALRIAVPGLWSE